MPFSNSDRAIPLSSTIPNHKDYFAIIYMAVNYLVHLSQDLEHLAKRMQLHKLLPGQKKDFLG